jgi:two-component system, NtrC family, nitrogen regulation sensor histidine kinase NtrY
MTLETSESVDSSANQTQMSVRNRLAEGFSYWARRMRLGLILTVTLVVAALAAGIGTYAVLSDITALGSEPDTVLLLLNVDLALLLILAIFVVRRIVSIWSERRKGSAGSRLHVRLVVLFGLVSVTPTIIVAIFSALFFNFGLESWFSERVRTALSASVAVADAYLQEHKQNIRADVLRMARDLVRDAPTLGNSPARFNQIVNLQSQLRGLTEAIVFTGDGQILARSGLTFVLEFEPVPESALTTARAGEVAILTSENDDRVRALVRLDNFVDTYLFVGRFVDPKVLGHMERTQGAVTQFERLELERADLQVSFGLIFLLVALLLLLAAAWIGLNFATQLSRPISLLIGATEKVRTGDLTARVPEQDVSDEVGMLMRAFNRMTSQLASQRHELINANEQLEERRRFTETVLAGVSAGVIGLDEQGRIYLSNRSASLLLGVELDEFAGQPLSDIVPEMGAMVQEARALRTFRAAESQINVVQNNEKKTLLVRVGVDRNGDQIDGFVVTFDDISELLSAQRKATWADVARRIAHEIKNPLTPIQLSAERLKRKYLHEIKSDPETFIICTDTIVRQVGDIGRMVDEFSHFARMPAPVIKDENATELCRQAVFLQRNANRHITFDLEVPKDPLHVPCDSQMLSQALTNLLQNAVDAIDGREGKVPAGQITLRLYQDVANTRTIIEVEDNGKGLPTEDRERLTEPYITTRHKGTGLGLAIVRKIMEDHLGVLSLGDASGGGALMRLELPSELSSSAEAVGSVSTNSNTPETADHGA